MGIVICTVIYLIVDFDLSFDRFHPDKDRIYRVIGERVESTGDIIPEKALSPPVAEAMRREIPGIETLAAFYRFSAKVKVPKSDLEIEDNQDQFIFTHPEYFTLFQFDWLEGNPSGLTQPFNVVISRKRAFTYFGDLPLNQIVGKELIYGDSLRMQVSGIVDDWDSNSDLPFTDFLSLATLTSSSLKGIVNFDDWFNKPRNPNGVYVFIKLAEQNAPESVNDRLSRFVQKYPMARAPAKVVLQLQPLTEMHFTEDLSRGTGILSDDGDYFRKAHLPTLYVLLACAVFVLIVAAVNFINLSTALSLRKAKEVAVRKILGSIRRNIVNQFLLETAVLTFLAVLLAIFLVEPTLILLDDFIPDDLVFDVFDPSIILFFLALAAVITVMAGLYPAMFLSSHVPALTLKGKTSTAGREKSSLRKALIIFQFVVSLLFISGAVVVREQIRFMQENPGVPADAIITLWCGKAEKMDVFSEKIKQLAGVKEVGLHMAPPIGMARMIQTLKSGDKELAVSVKVGDENFIKLYDIELLAGRNLAKTDTLKEFLINETYSKQLGFLYPQDALGQLIVFNNKSYPVTGVVEDFHEGSFHEKIMPMVIGNMPLKLSFAIRLTNSKGHSDIGQLISQIETQWKEVYPDKPFIHSFLSDEIAKFYEKERQTETLIDLIMIVTIIISSMGVFGLVMFSVEQKIAEIAIRKVLGASALIIVRFVTREIIIFSIAATLLATPIAWMLLEKWLQNFSYQIDLRIWVFVASGFSLLMIAFLTSSFYILKAARVNPAITLRSE